MPFSRNARMVGNCLRAQQDHGKRSRGLGPVHLLTAILQVDPDPPLWRSQYEPCHWLMMGYNTERGKYSLMRVSLKMSMQFQKSTLVLGLYHNARSQ